MKENDLILASGSPRRRELLSLYTTDFTVCVSDFDESAVTAPTPAQLVEQLAIGKCLAVAKQHPDAVVIGCDTVVDVDGTVFGKPHDAEDAKRSITEDGAQFNYGYRDGYFDNIIARIKEIDPEAFGDLVANIEKAKTLAERALNALMNGEYTSELTKVEKFGTEDWVYTLNDGKEFESIMNELYTEYSGWLAGWEL